jgi:hypothetical protein
VDAQRQIGLVVDLDGDARPPDGSGDGQVGAFAQDTRVQQRGDLTVHRRDAQRSDLGDDVTRDRTAEPGGAEHGPGRGVGHPQRRRDDVVTRQ